MNSEKKSAKQRFNIIDVLLIIILAVLIVLIFLRVRDYRIVRRTTSDAGITVKVEIKPVYDELKTQAEVGSRAYDIVTGDYIGEITDVSYSDYYLEGISESGERVRTRVPGMSAVTLTLSADVKKSSLGYTMNGKLLTIGDEIGIRTSAFSGTGSVTAISGDQSEGS